MLEEGREEEEDLHLSQTFSKAHSTAWQKRGRFSELINSGSNLSSSSVKGVPAEKGMKASLLMNLPSLSKK